MAKRSARSALNSRTFRSRAGRADGGRFILVSQFLLRLLPEFVFLAFWPAIALPDLISALLDFFFGVTRSVPSLFADRASSVQTSARRSHAALSASSVTVLALARHSSAFRRYRSASSVVMPYDARRADPFQAVSATLMTLPPGQIPATATIFGICLSACGKPAWRGSSLGQWMASS